MTSPVLDPDWLPSEALYRIAETVRTSYDIELPELPNWNSGACFQHGGSLKDPVPGCRKCGVRPRRHQRIGITWLWLMKRAGLFDSTGLGKAQPLDARVLTPSGWRLMGDLKSGDPLVDPEGEESHVEAVYPRGTMDVYRVTFSDGSQAESTLDHLWKVSPHGDGIQKYPGRGRSTGRGRYPASTTLGTQLERSTWRVRTLREIRDGLEAGGYQARAAIPLVTELPELCGDELPLSPYLMGLLLGDGCFRNSTPGFTTADQELVDAAASELPAGVSVVHTAGYDYSLTAGGRDWFGPNPLTMILRRMGLWGKYSHEKHIPPEYLSASVKSRLALLQGLMDTDGTASLVSGAEFTSSSRQLSADVAELARSLGISVYEAAGAEVSYTYQGECREARKRYRVNLRPADDMPLFRLLRKAEIRLPNVRHAHVKWIRAVEYSRAVPVQCIKVSASSSLYVTDGWTVTHNTVQIAGLLALMQQDGRLARKALIICRASTIGQWKDELARMIPSLQVITMTGTASQRGAKLSSDWEVAICGPEMLASKVTKGAAQLRQFDIGTVICDDIESLKNQNKTSATIKKLCVDTDRVVIATATPLDKRLGQLYDLGTIIGWESVFGSREEFLHRHVNQEQTWYAPRLKPVVCKACKTWMKPDFRNHVWVDGSKQTGPCPKRPGQPHLPLSRYRPEMKFNWVERGPVAENLPEFRAKLAPLVLRRLAADCDDMSMPDVEASQVWLDLGDQQKARYAEVKHGILSRMNEAGERLSKQEIENWWVRAWQVTSGLANLDTGISGESVKLDWVMEALTGDLSDEPVVVYCYFRKTLADLSHRLDKAGVANVRIWGAQDLSQTTGALSMFDSGAARVMLITDAGGAGLNLQKSRRLILVDTPRSAARVAQIIGRVKRDGSVHETCYVTQLLTTTPIERALAQMISREALMSAQVLDHGQVAGEFAPEDLIKAVTG